MTAVESNISPVRKKGTKRRDFCGEKERKKETKAAHSKFGFVFDSVRSDASRRVVMHCALFSFARSLAKRKLDGDGTKRRNGNPFLPKKKKSRFDFAAKKRWQKILESAFEIRL